MQNNQHLTRFRKGIIKGNIKRITTKKQISLLMKTHFCIFISILLITMLSACEKKTEREYLSEILENMNKVKSVKYHCVLKSWEPGVNDPVYNEQREIYEHVNPEDTAIGYSLSMHTTRNSSIFNRYMTELFIHILKKKEKKY